MNGGTYLGHMKANVEYSCQAKVSGGGGGENIVKPNTMLVSGRL